VFSVVGNFGFSSRICRFWPEIRDFEGSKRLLPLDSPDRRKNSVTRRRTSVFGDSKRQQLASDAHTFPSRASPTPRSSGPDVAQLRGLLTDRSGTGSRLLRWPQEADSVSATCRHGKRLRHWCFQPTQSFELKHIAITATRRDVKSTRNAGGP